jgi:hypothetical protein
MPEELENINLESVKSKLQLILNKSHSDAQKRVMRPKPYGARPVIEMACPICGDSRKSSSRKRGNLYLNNMFYVCFNCGEKISYIKLLERFGVGIDLDERMNIYEHVDKNTKFVRGSTDYDLSNLDKILKLDETIEIFNERKDDLYDISPIEKNSAVYQYLKYKRSISKLDDIYQGIYKVTDKWREPVMIILNRYDNNLLGFQLRNLKDEKRKRLYKIYDFESIYNYVNAEPIDDIESVRYNKMSHFYNLLNVDLYGKVTIFEGYLDSVFFPNSIGTTGVDTDYDFILENDIDVRFFYDNDEVGRKKTEEKIDAGYSVFLWNKLFKDLSKGVVKKEYFLKNNIKDLNDLVKLTKSDDVFNKFKLEEYFSIDEFDKIYI